MNNFTDILLQAAKNINSNGEEPQMSVIDNNVAFTRENFESSIWLSKQIIIFLDKQIEINQNIYYFFNNPFVSRQNLDYIIHLNSNIGFLIKMFMRSRRGNEINTLLHNIIYHINYIDDLINCMNNVILSCQNNITQ